MSEQVDRMGVLRHWECPKHGRSPAPFLTLEGVRLCGDPHCGLEAVEVEYVSASQLRGAVDLANAVDVFLRDMDALENPRPASSWFALKDALHAFRGGQ